MSEQSEHPENIKVSKASNELVIPDFIAVNYLGIKPGSNAKISYRHNYFTDEKYIIISKD